MPRLFSSLRAALLIPFVGVVVLVALSISLLSYQTGLKAVDELSEQLLLDISNRVTQATSRHLAASSVVLNAVAPDDAASGKAPRHADLVPVTLADFEHRMWIASNLFASDEGYLYYGSHAGEFVGLNRDVAGNYEIRWREADAPARTIYATQGPGLRGAVLRSDAYDPRTRPWFTAATQRGLLTWSSVYVDYTTRALTVTLAKPVFTQQRSQRGVIATDIPLTALTEFVRGLQVSQTGVAFIVERDGSLIATSTQEKLFGEDVGKPVRLHANESASALVRQAWAQLRTQGAPLRSVVQGVDIARYSFDGQDGRVHMSATAQRDGAGLDWTMVVAVPRSDHMGNLRRTILQNVGIGLVAIALAVAIGFWIMHRVTGDVRRLSEATRLLARGQSPERLFKGRRDELGVIARAMEDFKEGLLIDALTGALTRNAFEKRFATYVQQHADARLAIVFVDLDRFKAVNDMYGHAVGDAVLAIAAQRIAATLRRDDLLARFGGDEFVLLLPAVDSDDALNAQMARLAAALDAPIVVAGESVQAGGSCGGALYPRDGDSLDALLQIADDRMYDNKRQRATRRT
ncbi:MAG: diguanylate cyclase [Burkholderiales bacterium]|nr:diguanylate cyclase [Burkholderiales bacterium]